jgi:hypothetical protein
MDDKTLSEIETRLRHVEQDLTSMREDLQKYGEVQAIRDLAIVNLAIDIERVQAVRDMIGN